MWSNTVPTIKQKDVRIQLKKVGFETGAGN